MVPLLNCQSVSIWQPQLLRTAKWIRTLFKIFANKIAFLLTDGFGRFGIMRTHSPSKAHSAAPAEPDFPAAERAAAQEYLYSPVQMVAGSIGDAMLFFQYETVSIRISGYLKRPLRCL